MSQLDNRSEIELFLQGEGLREITLVKVPYQGTVQDIVEVARSHGLNTPNDVEVLVLLENTDEPLSLDLKIEAAGITHRSRVHVHQCRRVDVMVNYNADHKAETFPPSTTVARVKKWVVSKHGFDLSDIDASEHLLQLCNSTARPDEDIHIGTLVDAPACGLCFDLVAKQRIEG